MPTSGRTPANAKTGASITIRNLEKSYGAFRAVRDFSIDIAAGEFVSVLGASGSGKTTVLRMIAGLEEPSGGQIFIGGRDTTELPPEHRDIGLVFQDYALFPHMSVRDNICFPLRMRGVEKQQANAEAERMMDLVGAGHLGSRRPAQLSGGQQQRIALARALVFKPKLLLLDEPLSALDKNLREHMKAEIKDIHRRTGVTVLYVTHDQSEALALSDRIVVMRDGRILDVDEPNRLYRLPSSSYLASFIGDANLLPSKVTSVDRTALSVDGPLGSFSLPISQVRMKEEPAPGMTVTMVIRPENIIVGPARDLADVACIECEVLETLYNGSHTIYTLATVGETVKLTARCGEHQPDAFPPGSFIPASIRMNRSIIVSDDGASIAQ